MYAGYFGLSENPFSVTPDPRFFYANPAYQEAYANLLYGVRERKGFILVTGEVGTGKTTLLRRLITHIDPFAKLVFFYHTTLNFDEILSFVCKELGLEPRGSGRFERIEALNDFLLAQLKEGKVVALLVDEAQNLSNEVLENLRLLSNLETASEKLLQIVLVGQPELESKLDHPSMLPIKQRIAVRYRLSRLEEGEVGSFIEARLRVAGWEGGTLFTREAIRKIAGYSGGIPRLINIVCDNALLTAYAGSQKKVSATMIDEVARDLGMTRELPKPEEIETRLTDAGGIEKRQDPVATPTRSWLRGWMPGFRVILACLLVILIVGGGWILADSTSVQNAVSEWRAWVERVRGGETVKPVEPPTRVAQGIEAEQKNSERPGVAEPAPGAASPGDSSDFRKAAASQQPIDTGEKTSVEQEVSIAQVVEPMVVPAGATVFGIVSERYAKSASLALDLIRELNPNVKNMNLILAGQKLRLPRMDRGTLVRKQPDETYRVILTSQRGLSYARRFANTVSRNGYSVEITPRKISNDLLVQRIEITGLKDLQAVDEAWKVALTKGWLALSEDAP